MNRIQTVSFLAAALLAAGATSTAAAADSCPATRVFEDALDDAGLTPADAAPVAAPADPVGTVALPMPEADFASLDVSDADGKLTFTYKVASLETPLDSGGYIVRFSTDELPANGDEDFFVAMFNTPDGGTQFVHGTTGVNQEAGTGPRFFTINGDLDPASNFAADGTITLVVGFDALPGVAAGLDIYNMIASVRLLAPLVATAAGMTTNASNGTVLDDSGLESGFYTVGSCGKAGAAKSGGMLAAGAFGLPGLLGLAGLAALARRRRA